MASKITPKIKDRIFNATNGRCWYCGVALERIVANYDGTFSCTARTFVIEHQWARHLGGTDDLPNLVAACHSCNSSKGVKTVEEFRRWRIYRQGGFFTEEQVAFWRARGVELPVFPASELPVFYGESL